MDWYRDTEKDDGGFSLEIINPDSECQGAANWVASTSSLGGTPGEVNAVFSLKADSIAPIFIRSEILDSVTLLLEFSEELRSSTINTSAFQVDDLTISQLNANENSDEVTLIFDASIPADIAIELLIDSLQDCSGNAIEALTILFGYGETPAFGDLVITEIMSDPDPEQGLPNAEYIEIYNRSDKLIGLDEVFITDASNTTANIGGLILPGEYSLLIPSSEISEFGDFQATAVSNWASLSNSGELLSLRTSEGIIFQINYTSDWHDTDKQPGGFSLEMRDFENPCGEDSNWGSSIDNRGGTPGEANSIAQNMPDNFGPNVTNAIALSEDSIVLFFDEQLNPSTGVSISLNGGVSVISTELLENLKELLLIVEPDLTQGQEYEITISSLQDCLGNNIQENVTSVVLPFEAIENEILISEILFDPRPDGFDFVEVYNASDEFLSLEGWTLKNANSEEVIEEKMVIAPKDYKVLTEDKASLLLFYPASIEENIAEIASLPTLSNDEGVITIYNEDILLDSLFYEDDFHSSLLEDVEGVSLERISFDDPNNAENWTSAASTVGFATPGYANSQELSLVGAVSDPVEAEPKVFVPGSGINSFTTINYEFDAAGFFANIYLYDQNGRLVKTLGEGISLASDGFVRWDGTTDLGGTARMGYYVVIFEIYDGQGSTEIFKETVVVGRDF